MPKLTAGQSELGAVLLLLPRHRLDSDPHHEARLVRRLADVPDDVLHLVAHEIAARCWPAPRHPFAETPRTRPQPRLAEIERMVDAAIQARDRLNAIAAPRRRMRRTR